MLKYILNVQVCIEDSALKPVQMLLLNKIINRDFLCKTNINSFLAAHEI